MSLLGKIVASVPFTSQGLRTPSVAVSPVAFNTSFAASAVTNKFSARSHTDRLVCCLSAAASSKVLHWLLVLAVWGAAPERP